jgi:hypothetical protein
MTRQRHTTLVVVLEGALGGVFVLVGITLAFLAVNWTVAFWIVTVGAAFVGHAVTFGFGLLDRPYFWRSHRDR